MTSKQRAIGVTSSRWQLQVWSNGSDLRTGRIFADRHAALNWLRQFRSDSAVMMALRSAARGSALAGAALPLQDDHQLLEAVSWLISRGELQVSRLAAPATGSRVAGVAAQTQATTTSSRPTPSRSSPGSAPAKQADEADTFSALTDAAQTAVVLCEAAASGVPFCEECAKAAASRKAA